MKRRRITATQRQTFFNRVKQALAAALGLFAIGALTIHRASQDRKQDIHYRNAARFLGGFATAGGLAWFFMPSSKESLSEACDETKRMLLPTVKQVITDAMGTPAATAAPHHYRYDTPKGQVASAASYQRGVERVNQRVAPTALISSGGGVSKQDADTGYSMDDSHL